MQDRVETSIPGREPIELVAYYDELRDYYAQCELETKRWFVDHVRADWSIFDVGANIGYYTILFSQLAPHGRVFAFEPTATAAMLRANLAHNNVGNAEIHEVAFSADDTQIVTASADGNARVWSAATGLRLTNLKHADSVDAAAFSLDGTRVATASGHLAQIWDSQTGQPITSPFEYQGSILSLAFSAQDTNLIVASSDQGMRVWGLRTESGTLDRWQQIARCGLFTLDGSVLSDNPEHCP